jgi:DNA primase
VIPIPQQYVIETFYRCVSYPTHNKYTNTYNGSCPFCKEGKSFGRKKRFFYIPEKELCYCHNCGYSKKVFNFILDATGKPFNEVINEVKKYEVTDVPAIQEKTQEKVINKSLPDDCINLSDKNQLEFHKDNEVVKICLDIIHKRRLNTAVNRPKTFYISLTDIVHKNRLILPFYNENGDIIFYQTRTLLQRDEKLKPKYLSKVKTERSLYGVHNIDSSMECIYIFEGPIDSYFIRNGLAVCGIAENSERTFTEQQQSQINKLSSFKKVWCLDNQWNDNASLKKSILLADKDEHIFIWPDGLKKYKDFNELCVKFGRDSINPEMVVNHTYSGLKAKILLTTIKNKRAN